MQNKQEEGRSDALVGRLRRPTDIELVGVELVSGLFILIGLAAFALLFVSINGDPSIQEATQWPNVATVDEGLSIATEDATVAARDVIAQIEDALETADPSDLDALEQTLKDAVGPALEQAAEDYDLVIDLEALETSLTTAIEETITEQRETQTTTEVELDPEALENLENTIEEAFAAIREAADTAGVDIDVEAAKTSLMAAVAQAGAGAPPVDLGEALATALDAAVEEGIQIDMGALEASLETQRPSLILAFLDSFGIVLPVLIIVLGGLFVRLGLHLRQHSVTSARWAQIALLWLIVGVILMMLMAFFNAGRPPALAEDRSFRLGLALETIIPYLIALIPLGIALYWISQVLDEIFPGEETISSRDTRMAWNLLIPTLAVLIAVAARPLEETFITSLTDKRFAGSEAPRFVGLQNYANLLTFRLDTVECQRVEETDECETRDDGSIKWQNIDVELLRTGYREVGTLSLFGEAALRISSLDADFLNSVGNTLLFTFVSVVLELVLGMFIALTVNSSFAGRGLMRAVMLVPWAIPTVISARLWELMLKDNRAGILNKIMLDVGLVDTSQAWLANPALQIPSLILVDVWKTAPFMALLLLAGLQTIPREMYEAASVDGANVIRRFLSLTLPLLRPTIAVALVFRTLDALRAFDVFQVLLGRQKLSMAVYNWETLVQNQEGGYASAVGVLIFVIIFVFAVIYVRMLGVETE